MTLLGELLQLLHLLILSVQLVELSLKFSGLGIVAITALGIIYFEARLDMIQFGCIGLIFIGAVGLSLTTNSSPH